MPLSLLGSSSAVDGLLLDATFGSHSLVVKELNMWSSNVDLFGNRERECLWNRTDGQVISEIYYEE